MSMKLNKSIAGLTAPDAGSVGFANQSQASTASAVIIVGFVEIEVYGLNGGTWSLIDTMDDYQGERSPDGGMTSFNESIGTNNGFKSDHTTVNLADYEDVFFVSKTGQQEPVRYFFVEDAVVAPRLVDEEAAPLKLEEISDVPAFTLADAGKILSVDAQGNLAWIAR